MLGRLPVTVELGLLAILIGLVIALPVGIYSAVRQYTVADYVGRSVAIMGLATPNFWLGTMVMIYPAIWWAWSPRMELIPLAQDPLGNLGMFLIPSLILGTYLAASTMRMTRTMMLEVLRQDILVLVSIFADGLAPYRFEEIHLRDRLQAPSAQYLLGTDHVGRDLLSRLIPRGEAVTDACRPLGLAATALNVVVAVLIGGTTGFIGGRLDLVTQRFVDAWMAFPGLLLLLTIMSIAGRGMLQIIIVLGVSGGIPASRVVRGAVLGVKENVYFQAAQAIGSSRRRSLLRHVLPNIAAPIIIIFSNNVGGVIMSEAALSFLGFGLPPDIPSWGGMLSREGRQYMEMAPHLALWPGLCLTVVVYSLNMFGDAVRDLLDPRLRGRLGRYGVGKGQLTPS